MHIHFICSGNIFRSLLSEIYLNSKKVDNISASSSGINAKIHQGKIKWCTYRLIQNYELTEYFSKYGTQTTQQEIEKADLLVFLQQQYFDYCRSNLKLNNKKYQIWNIADISDKYLLGKHTIVKDIRVIKFSEEIFKQIKKEVDLLVENLIYEKK
jgi:protein-tyrosine-phosphatase